MKLYKSFKMLSIILIGAVALTVSAQEQKTEQPPVVVTDKAKQELEVADKANEGSATDDELDVMITVVGANDSALQAVSIITLPPFTPPIAQEKSVQGLDKANNASETARSLAQERINNILGDPALDNAADRLPGDLRRVIPPRPPKPPKPPKPKKGKPK